MGGLRRGGKYRAGRVRGCGGSGGRSSSRPDSAAEGRSAAAAVTALAACSTLHSELKMLARLTELGNDLVKRHQHAAVEG